MIKIYKFESDMWVLIEEMQDDLALAQRLAELRQDGFEYRAELQTISGSEILGV